ncbi:MAG: phosphocarrier protein HPr [Actinomycetota bacterium]|nr:phosphocarrier protein HPr [Actinomycetota bacterium]
MAEVTVTLPEGVGLHARPAAMFVQAATAAPMPVTVGRPGDAPVDAKSILSVMGMGVKAGEVIVVTAEGDGAEDVLAGLKTLLETPEA